MSKFSRIKSEYKSISKSIPALIKYQIITNLLLFGIIVPLFWSVSKILIESQGFVAVSNSALLEFLLSKYGFIFVTLLFVIAIRWMFTFHFISIAGFDVKRSMKESSKMIRKNILKIIVTMLLFILITLLIVIPVTLLWLLLITTMIKHVGLTSDAGRILSMIMILIQNAIIGLSYLLVILSQVYLLTRLFYRFVSKDEELEYLAHEYPHIPTKTKLTFIDKILKRRKTLIALFLLVLIMIAVPTGLFFHEIFMEKSAIQIVGHRGGGVHAAENSLEGINKAIEKKVDWSEIDVQRSKDGVYILNHDDTFKRLAGVNLRASDMNYDEIKKLEIRNLNNPAMKNVSVPKLEEALDLAKDKIGLFIELKGKTADIKMVDDVVKMVKSRNMINQTVLVCFDYSLVTYIEQKYPEINSGFIYFLAIGDVSKLEGDYLILEEDAASDSVIEKISNAGKKSVIWTVNTAESIDKQIRSYAEAIIIDQLDLAKKTLEEYNKRDDRDILREMLLLPKEDK
ncbi:glycerophosphodiester phosphodiesterase family protein [Microaceticoccus formicicus]|uniref:glycerophosphodiester phosphodiesterase family protein n=1 Tax=Microaceticoccus formicicus TaxID=3118105 RepID=UPI003CD022DE|nr:glycerophosphodiester phosphodiesterase family protein [Peptoniphilaceae bacterium AMB_02]